MSTPFHTHPRLAPIFRQPAQHLEPRNPPVPLRSWPYLYAVIVQALPEPPLSDTTSAVPRATSRQGHFCPNLPADHAISYCKKRHDSHSLNRRRGR